MKLCLGDEWYGAHAQPFLTARASKDDINIEIESGNTPNSPGPLNVSAKRVVTDEMAWHFHIGIFDACNTNTGVQEEFEWHTHQTFRIRGQDGSANGSFLIRKSNGYAVAHLKPEPWRWDAVVSGEVIISFLGAGLKYGGLWKIIVFVIGCCAQ